MVFTLPLNSLLKYAYLLPFHHQNLGRKNILGGGKKKKRKKESVLESGAHHKFMKLSEYFQKQTRLRKQRKAESVLQENFFDSVEETLIFTLHLRLKSIVQSTAQTAKSFHVEFTHRRHSKQHFHYFPLQHSLSWRGMEIPRESQTPSNPCPAL